jgi:predicted RNase H-like HicB family nuclease
MKKQEYNYFMKENEYIIIKEGNGYVALSTCTGVASQGFTLNEAVDNLEEAVALYVLEFTV